MRTTYRFVSATIALGAVFPLGLPVAHADTVSESAAAGAYYSRTTPAKPDALPADPGPQFNGLGADQVAPGNLAVAVTAPDGSDKESFLRFDLMNVPFDATITSAVVTVPLADNAQGNQSANVDSNLVRACAAGPEGFADADAGAYDEKPSSDCGVLDVIAEPTADGKAYLFDVTAVATTWLSDVNNGIALVPVKFDTPFQVVFKQSSYATIAVAYTPAATVVEPPVDVPVDAPPVDSGGFSGGIDVGGFVPVPQPEAQPPAAPAPRPVVSTPPAPISKVASSPLVEDNSIPATFWVAAGLGALLLAVTSLVLGDDRAPVAVAGGESQLDRVLRARQGELGSTPGARRPSRLRTI